MLRHTNFCQWQVLSLNNLFLITLPTQATCPSNTALFRCQQTCKISCLVSTIWCITNTPTIRIRIPRDTDTLLQLQQLPILLQPQDIPSPAYPAYPYSSGNNTNKKSNSV